MEQNQDLKRLPENHIRRDMRSESLGKMPRKLKAWNRNIQCPVESEALCRWEESWFDKFSQSSSGKRLFKMLTKT